MDVFRQKKVPLKLLGRRVRLGVLFALVVIIAPGVWSAYQKERESAAQRTEAERELADLSARQSKLDTDMAILKTSRGKEEALREQYALAAEGEGLIVIVDPATPTPVAATSSAFAQWVHKVFPWW
ncbi:MAG: hypothetical protein RLZZ416_82 [Candidatus Parcubacteria bacterium]|jgi:cell division protein FtsB